MKPAYRALTLCSLALLLVRCSSSPSGGSPAPEPADAAAPTSEPDAAVPPACDDQAKNADETDVDCGGPTCAKCAADRTCVGATDCKDGACIAGLCKVPTCHDGVTDGTETDKDCGGSCGKCSAGATCNTHHDCKGGLCAAGDGGAQRCEITCSDGERNGAETDIDCGGSCPACVAGQECAVGADCEGATCTAHACQLPSCLDGVVNGHETDTNCGGGDCAKCNDGLTCAAPTDCKSGACEAKVCISCSDGLQNGLETDKDCGGTTCAKCDEGRKCLVDGDCVGGLCTNLVCTLLFTGTGTVADPYKTTPPLATCAAYLARFPTLVQSGVYRLKAAAPFTVPCDMTTSGGGWMQLTSAGVAAIDVAATKEYLYVAGTKWYRSPTTMLVWTWAAGVELAGTYAWFDGTATGTSACAGSGEKPAFGVGCSNGGGGTTKVLPYYNSSAATGQCTICQDSPNAFQSTPCVNNVNVFVR